MSRAKVDAATAVHKHERNMHPGKPLTPMKMGGTVESPMRKMARSPNPSTPMKSGGRMCKAVGGVAKIRHDQATPKGAPKASPRRFKKGGLI